MNTPDLLNDEALTEHERAELCDLVAEGNVGASVIVLGAIARHLGELDADIMADVSLSLGDTGDWIETAIANVVTWYREGNTAEFEQAIVRARLAAIPS
jgi:DNA-binding beta-propeller fold protein YncE